MRCATPPRRLGADAVLALIAERPTHGAEPPDAGRRGAGRRRRLHRADHEVALAHAGAQARHRSRRARGDAARRHRRPAGAGHGGRLRRACASAAAPSAARLDAADDAHITCPRGTDLRLDLRGRRGIPDDGDLVGAGAFGNLPCGEGFIAPAGGEGRRRRPRASARSGSPTRPFRLEVRDGRLAAAGNGAGEAFLSHLLQAGGELGANLAELGVGTNDRATLTGNILEDEKILGTVHVAFGASAAIGGTVSVPVHEDVVVLDATLEVGGRRCSTRGRLVV